MNGPPDPTCNPMPRAEVIDRCKRETAYFVTREKGEYLLPPQTLRGPSITSRVGKSKNQSTVRSRSSSNGASSSWRRRLRKTWRRFTPPGCFSAACATPPPEPPRQAGSVRATSSFAGRNRGCGRARSTNLHLEFWGRTFLVHLGGRFAEGPHRCGTAPLRPCPFPLPRRGAPGLANPIPEPRDPED